jgi:nitrate reductase assembly molybdenum cofactor insertion protein NarJ
LEKVLRGFSDFLKNGMPEKKQSRNFKMFDRRNARELFLFKNDQVLDF